MSHDNFRSIHSFLFILGLATLGGVGTFEKILSLIYYEKINEFTSIFPDLLKEKERLHKEYVKKERRRKHDVKNKQPEEKFIIRVAMPLYATVRRTLVKAHIISEETKKRKKQSMVVSGAQESGGSDRRPVKCYLNMHSIELYKIMILNQLLGGGSRELIEQFMITPFMNEFVEQLEKFYVVELDVFDNTTFSRIIHIMAHSPTALIEFINIFISLFNGFNYLRETTVQGLLQDGLKFGNLSEENFGFLSSFDAEMDLDKKMRQQGSSILDIIRNSIVRVFPAACKSIMKDPYYFKKSLVLESLKLNFNRDYLDGNTMFADSIDLDIINALRSEIFTLPAEDDPSLKIYRELRGGNFATFGYFLDQIVFQKVILDFKEFLGMN